MKLNSKIIIAGGGTGGHIFPAISIGVALREIEPSCDLLFVGAEGRMEMSRIPEAGFTVRGLPMLGMPRSRNPIHFIRFIWAWYKSLVKAYSLLKEFKPHAVVGVGGYASVPVMMLAQLLGIPTIIQEQNSLAGKANKLLSKRADLICVSYSNMDRFFPARKIVFTGNPIRQVFANSLPTSTDSRTFLGIKGHCKVVLILGGSLGARSLNEAIISSLDNLRKHQEIFVILQCGAKYINSVQRATASYQGGNLLVTDFISRMDMAYAAADLIVSRAGACTISELCIIGKPVVFVPSPNVAENHQDWNARAVEQSGAAVVVPDSEVNENLFTTIISLLDSSLEMKEMASAILKLKKCEAAQDIAKNILKLARSKEEIYG